MVIFPATFLMIAAILALGPNSKSSSLPAEKLRVHVGTDTPQDGRRKGIYTCLFDSATGQLTEPTLAGEVVNPAFLPIHPSGNFASTNNETTLVATGFKRDAKTGAFTKTQDITTISDGDEGRGSTAECLCHPSRKFLYVSNRGPDLIAVYSIDQTTGLLTWVENKPTEGKTPPNFIIDPGGKWLLAKNLDSDSVVVSAIDQKKDSLSATGDSTKVGKPVCIRMVAEQ